MQKAWIALVAALGIALAGGYEFTLGSARSFSPAVNLGLLYWQRDLGLRLGLDLPAPNPVLEAGVLGQSGPLRYGLGLVGYLGDGLGLFLGGYLGYRWELPDGAGLTLEYAPILPYLVQIGPQGVRGGWLAHPLAWALLLSHVRLYLSLPLEPLPQPPLAEPAGFALGVGAPLTLEAEYDSRLGPRYRAWLGAAWFAWEKAVGALAGAEARIERFFAGPYLGLGYGFREGLQLRAGARLGAEHGAFGVVLLYGSRLALSTGTAGRDLHLLFRYRLGP